MNHTAAWQLHPAVSAVDVEWILYSRHIDCYSSPTERLSTFKPKYAWCCHQGTDEVDVFAHVKESRSHRLFGVIVHRQGIVKVNTRVLYSS